MTSHSVPTVNAARRIARPGRLFLAVLAMFRWQRRRSTRVLLDRLSDRDLRDVGLERTGRGYRATPGSAAGRQGRVW